MPHSYHQLDRNHKALVAHFRSKGCSVLSTSSLSGGAPDAFVAFGGFTAAVEFKDGSKPPSKRALRPSQIAWRAGWLGMVRTIETEADADRLMADLGAWSFREPGPWTGFKPPEAR